MTVVADIQKLDPGALVVMFEINTSTIGGSEVFYFHDGTDGNGGSIVWQGNTYSKWPIDADGFDKTTKGALPRPTLTIANVLGAMFPVLKTYDDLVGAKIIRRRTFAQYLDGQPGANPNEGLPDDVYYVERKKEANPVFVVLELSSALDLQGVRLPSRPITSNSCTWEYRVLGECPYQGTNYFDVNDQPVANANLDVCSKKVSGCKVRFGQRAKLPFGGFPAARTYKL